MSLSDKVIQRYSPILVIACGLGCISCGDCVETPAIASVTPTSATVGSASLTLIVNGNHFERDSTIKWNGTALVTTFVNGTKLTAVVTAEEMATVAEVSVRVFTPPQSQPVTFETNATSSAGSSLKVDCSGGTSNALNFRVQP